MTICEEIKVVIAQLPTQKAIGLSVLLNQYENVRRNKLIKEYADILVSFKRSESSALCN